MANARPFWTSTLQELFNDTKNTPRQGVFPLAVELQTFGSPGALQVPNFGNVSFILTLGQSGVATYVILHLGKPSIHNLSITGTIKIPGLSRLEPSMFGRLTFEGFH
jgi:hypothetical protein